MIEEDISNEELRQIARTVDRLFIRDLCDCDIDAKDNGESCTCGAAWYKRDLFDLKDVEDD